MDKIRQLRNDARKYDKDTMILQSRNGYYKFKLANLYEDLIENSLRVWKTHLKSSDARTQLSKFTLLRQHGEQTLIDPEKLASVGKYADNKISNGSLKRCIHQTHLEGCRPGIKL